MRRRDVGDSVFIDRTIPEGMWPREQTTRYLKTVSVFIVGDATGAVYGATVIWSAI